METKSLVLYPGTFDPITLGHIDIIKRASGIFREVVVAVVKNPSKDTLFSYQERLELVKSSIKNIKNTRVVGFTGLVVDFAKSNNIKVVIRGLRMISDFEYEFQMALTNRSLVSQIETIFLMPSPQYSYISSKLIKEAAFLGADLKKFLPKTVIKALKKKINLKAKINENSSS
ncbi:MAG: pantetheine-phosphate adenylyltransferase [Candidatus Omnitrophica bacterium]|nr:pantetheine-phosphate adenylyltransferase [Candidatus Omnitrophota bacterium]